MKKLVFVLLLAFLLTGCVSDNQNANNTVTIAPTTMPTNTPVPAILNEQNLFLVNGIAFGMSQSEVVNNDKRSLTLEQENGLVYNNNESSFEFINEPTKSKISYVYLFKGNTSTNNRLVGYNIIFDDTNTYKYPMDDYSNIKNLLIKKLGKPNHENIIWNNDFYKSDTGKWNKALNDGNFKIESFWENNEDRIVVKWEKTDKSILIFTLNRTPKK